MTILRPYQSRMIEQARDAFRSGHRAVLMQLPTGGGKTYLASTMVDGASRRGNVCLWLTHRRELISQASRSFSTLGIPHSTIQGGVITDPTAAVQIGSIQTVARRLDRLTPPQLIVFDETHHIGATQWQQIFDHYPDARVVGLTATPWRLDGRGLGTWYSTMINGPTVAELIESGSLSEYRLFAPATPDMGGVGSVGGDYQRRDLARVMDKPSITGDAVAHYRRLCPGKRAVAFAVSIEHSQHIAASFNEAGIPAEHVDGGTDPAERDNAVKRFERGDTLVLCNAELFGEGFDVPAIEAAILLRPTQSLSLYLQQVGRALRPSPGKAQAIILDHAGNSARHGLPDDEREWTLEDRKKKRRASDGDAVVRQCPECFRVYRPAPKCPGCGFETPVVGRVVEEVDGVLAEVDLAQQRREQRLEEAKCQSLDDWMRLAAARGYKPGWAYHRFQARQRRAA